MPEAPVVGAIKTAEQSVIAQNFHTEVCPPRRLGRDFTTLTARATGTFTITGGEGIFAGATGTLDFSEVDALSLDPTVPTRAKSSVNGSIQVFPSKAVPEPRTVTMLVGMGIIGAGFLLRRHSQRATSV